MAHFHRNGQQDLDRQKERDLLKAERCHTDWIVLIVVPYYHPDIEGFVRKELEELGAAR
jgi:hypothetical protein